jgi:hypothetical protein
MRNGSWKLVVTVSPSPQSRSPSLDVYVIQQPTFRFLELELEPKPTNHPLIFKHSQMHWSNSPHCCTWVGKRDLRDGGQTKQNRNANKLGLQQRYWYPTPGTCHRA